MLHIYKGQNNNLIFTALELCILTAPKYLFIFTGANEKIVKFVGTNLSTDARYQKVLVLDKVFKNSESGTWRYEIREQASTTNLDPLLSGGIVEEGFMYLHDAVVCTPDEYTDQCNEFKTYKGE
jgi:hypothetical protein